MLSARWPLGIAPGETAPMVSYAVCVTGSPKRTGPSTRSLAPIPVSGKQRSGTFSPRSSVKSLSSFITGGEVHTAAGVLTGCRYRCGQTATRIECDEIRADVVCHEARSLCSNAFEQPTSRNRQCATRTRPTRLLLSRNVPSRQPRSRSRRDRERERPTDRAHMADPIRNSLQGVAWSRIVQRTG